MKAVRFRRWTWSRRTAASAILTILVMGAREWFPWFRGSFTASTLFGAIPLTDPLAAIEIVLASGRLDSTLLAGLLIPVAACLLLGPVFCGWICPLGLILDLNDGVRERLDRWGQRIGFTLPRAGLPFAWRYAALGGAVGFSTMAGIPAFQTVSPISFIVWVVVFYPDPVLASDGTSREKFVAILESVAGAGGVMLIFLILILVVELAEPRLWCRTLCPLGALNGLIGRAAPLRIRIDRMDCPARCRQCTIHCPMRIAVEEDHVSAGKTSIVHAACTRCGECIDRCPKGRLRLGFKAIPNVPCVAGK